MQWPRSDGDDLFPLKSLNLSGSSDVVVGAVAQPVIVPFTPGDDKTHKWAIFCPTSVRQDVTTDALCSVIYIPRVHGTRLSESHRKLRATLHFDHSEAGERVDLKTRNQYINLGSCGICQYMSIHQIQGVFKDFLGKFKVENYERTYISILSILSVTDIY